MNLLKSIIILVLLSALMSCGGGNKQGKTAEPEHEEHSEGEEGVVKLSEKQRDALGLKLGTFEQRNLTTLVKTNGQLEVPPAASASVTAIIGGNVKSIKVFQGDKVRKGQVLASLEHPDYISLQEDYAEVANRLDFLELEYERQKKLFENNVGAGKDFQQVKAEFATARAKAEGLKARLRLLHLSPEDAKIGKISSSVNIFSPISGYVNEVNISLGTYANSEEELFNLTNNQEIHADFMVYENDVHLIKVGQKIDFTVSNRPGEELTATIFAIGKEFEPNTRAVHVHATIDKNPGNLIPGMYVSGNIHTDKNYVPALPNEAIVSEGTKSYIFILDKKGTAHDDDDSHDKAEEHEHSGNEEHSHDDKKHAHSIAFRMIEVITGKQDNGYTAVTVLEALPDNAEIVLNSAYYLLAEIGKEETEHAH
ncbi:MAG: efflux RND transporter periplasmic adaptor subunit [Bacteroidales bacterium]